MLQISQFDIKTGKPIKESIGDQQQPLLKEVEHSYLERWLEVNQIDARFSVGRFYESVNDTDRIRLEAEGKALVFTNGRNGYFTDPETAKLMTEGSEIIQPIYASGQDSPHNSVAYGSLISSDGVASTNLPSAQILIIDDETRSHGSQPLLDSRGREVSEKERERLYDKMGDGTMLVSEKTMQALQTQKEHEEIVLKASEASGISSDISTLTQDFLQTIDKISPADTALDETDRQENKLASQSVYQFRAATPDLPGIAKGTVTSSQWCQRLGVEAIISRNDVKGDDGKLATPGIKEVENFWINRKDTAKYGQQAVGPQVKQTIPEATYQEINPQVRSQAEALTKVSGDLPALSQHYIEQVDRERLRPVDILEEESLKEKPSDWLYDVLKADQYGQLTDQAKIVDNLSRHVKGEWRRLATHGTSVPSAMAQPHSQLRPWEICNKDLPHGAIIAYYRSPFPNVGAAVIAINNTQIIREKDGEAFRKNGVAYLPPGTAKNIAITDFDGDRNGFFIGYKPTVPNLPEQIRAELASSQSKPLEQQYEVGRAKFEQMIHQLEAEQEDRIIEGDYPLAVKEFAEQNAPDVKPPQINKQKKDKHPRHQNESHAEATWRAWSITADNPTGKVANAGMALQALALEIQYSPVEEKEALLRQVSEHFTEVLSKVTTGDLSIPDDSWLADQGFSPFYEERIETIAESGSLLNKIEDSQERSQFSNQYLQLTSELLFDIANGPNALNLQTAVDTAKSAKGIDLMVRPFF